MGKLGLCATDQDRIAQAVNEAQAKLLLCQESSDEGWMGTWAEMAFNVSQALPYLTTPRDVARIEKMTVCQRPVSIQNQFYEYLAFGNGPQPNACFSVNQGCLWNVTAYSRNNAVMFKDLSGAPQYIRIYPTDTSGVDVGKRVLLQGTDSTGSTLYSTDHGYQVTGTFVTLAAPFVDASILGVPVAWNTITGIQKDITVAPIQIKQVDPVTGAEVLLHIMEPSEQVASYRRYYLHDLPSYCCDTSSTNILVTAIAKLELIPVVADTDYLLIQNIYALMEECQAQRYSDVDSLNAKQMASYHHKEAVRLLNGELVHLLGREKPAISFYPFGSWDPVKSGVGML